MLELEVSGDVNARKIMGKRISKLMLASGIVAGFTCGWALALQGRFRKRLKEANRSGAVITLRGNKSMKKIGQERCSLLSVKALPHEPGKRLRAGPVAHGPGYQALDYRLYLSLLHGVQKNRVRELQRYAPHGSYRYILGRPQKARSGFQPQALRF